MVRVRGGGLPALQPRMLAGVQCSVRYLHERPAGEEEGPGRLLRLGVPVFGQPLFLALERTQLTDPRPPPCPPHAFIGFSSHVVMSINHRSSTHGMLFLTSSAVAMRVAENAPINADRAVKLVTAMAPLQFHTHVWCV